MMSHRYNNNELGTEHHRWPIPHPESSWQWQRAMVLCTHPLQSHLAERGRKELDGWEFPNYSPWAGKAAFDRTSQGFVLNNDEWRAKVKICISSF